MKGLLLGSVCAAVLSVIATPGLCQTASAAPSATPSQDTTPQAATAKKDSGDDTTVIVTATRRKEKLQDVPLSITAFSQKELTAKGIVGFEGLGHETPGVVINRPSANFNYFTARGVATNSGYGAGLQSAVAIYVDEQPINDIGNTTNLDPNLFDVERVEFLRGPQGTLFGSGSLAGALRIIQHAPDLTSYSASFLTDIGVVGKDSVRQRYDLMVNTPLIRDVLALRVVAFYRDEEGYIDNVGTGKKNANTLLDAGGRASLLWKANDRLSVKFLASTENSDPKDSSMTSPNLGLYTKVSDAPDLFTGRFNSFNTTIDYQFDGAHFMSSSTYSDFDQDFVCDLAGTFNSAIPFGLDAYSSRHTFVEEARLVSNPGGKLDWTLGGFYLARRQTLDYELRSETSYLVAHGITGLSDDHFYVDRSYARSGEEAVYGDLTYHFSNKIWATAGLRYGGAHAQNFDQGGFTTGNLYYVDALYGYSFPLTKTPVGPSVGVKISDDKPSYRLSLSYKPYSNLTTYATISTGFRVPIVNALAGSVSTVNPNDLVVPYGAKSDSLTNYELGAKGRWFDNRVAGSVAVYQIDWDNIQVQANRVSDGVQFATNIGGATSKGAEWELQFYPTHDLVFGFNGAVNQSKVTKLTAEQAAISGAVMGAPLSSPKFQATGYVNYGFNLTPDARANWSLTDSYVGAFPNEFPNTPGNPSVPMPTFGYTNAFSLVNTTFAVSVNRYTIGAYIENLTNSHAVAYIHPETFFVSRYSRLTPRTIGIRLTADY